MSQNVLARYETSEKTIAKAALELDAFPDSCPLCHQGIEPIFRSAWLDNPHVAILFQCPRSRCRRLFLSMYDKNERAYMGGPDVFDLKGSAPWKPREHIFPDEIKTISSMFCTIYNESEEAEQRGLKNICGPGYRKALEFLIKDYVTNEKGVAVESIRGANLGTCIDEHIDDENIKDCAKRAAWLGNDQTHYDMKWEDKVLNDLKNLIELTVTWIHSEYVTKKIKEEMPEGKSKGRK